MGNFRWGSTSKRRMEGVNPLLVEFANRLLHESPWDLSIPWRGGVRTAEQQKEIFDRGASKADGYNKKSYHQSGNAIDICIYSKNIDEMYDREKLDHLGEIGKEIWLEMYHEGKLNDWNPIWGGSWRFYDPVHWELRAK